ncbi:hypothetical protein H8958_022819 [Nasalis larvatus]
MLMLCMEWWAYEVGSFLSGILGMVELGAQSIVYELAILVYMVPAGFSVAASVRVGNALGAGDMEQARKSSTVSLLITVLFAVDFSVLLLSCKDHVGYLFTTDQDIINLLAQVVPIYAVSHLFEALACASGGVLRGSGNQKVGAIVNTAGYYVLGLPIGTTLIFATKLGVMAKSKYKSNGNNLTVYIIKSNGKNRNYFSINLVAQQKDSYGSIWCFRIHPNYSLGDLELDTLPKPRSFSISLVLMETPVNLGL